MSETTFLNDIQPIDRSSKQIVLILGGYGLAGLKIVDLLLRATTNVKIVLAGRNLDKANATAEKLNGLCNTDRCSGVQMDASKQLDFSGIDLVVVASPSLGSTVTNIANTALAAKIDYFDIQYSSKKLETLKSLESEIKAAGLCFITDGGVHPGLPAALVRYAAGRLDRVKVAHVGGLFSFDWTSVHEGTDTKEEFISEMMNFDSQVYSYGEWKQSTWTKPRLMDFGEFGKQNCIAMNLEEMHDIPKSYPDIQEMGFYMAGFNCFTDWLLMPIVVLVILLCPCRAVKRAMGRFFFWALKLSSRPPYGTMFVTDVRGTNAGRNVTINVSIYHEDAYWLTAIPATACILQYLDGSIKKPGLWFQGSCVAPARFMKDMQALGAECKTIVIESDK